MNSQDLLLMNILGAGAFLAWYAVSRGGGKRPTRLRMDSARESGSGALKKTSPAPTTVLPKIPPRSPAAGGFPTASKKETEKNLNVIFIYNAHSWDAYEVLGVPAGSSLKNVTEAYQAVLRSCEDRGSIEFHEAAYQAILKKETSK